MNIQSGQVTYKAQRIPSINIPAGQPLVARTHLGDLMGGSWPVEENTIHIMAGNDVIASNTDYWTLEIGVYQDGGWSTMATVTTRPQNSGGLGDMFGGVWYEIPAKADAFGWRSALAVKATPTGSPDSPSFLVAFPNASIVP